MNLALRVDMCRVRPILSCILTGLFLCTHLIRDEEFEDDRISGDKSKSSAKRRSERKTKGQRTVTGN